jgi:DNA repair exonuclease SbcCD ATPase subunit
MKTSKIVIKNLFGISEQRIDGGKSVELSGPKGAGKTSVLDAIRYALTNRSDRDYIIRQGADEGEILIETDTGLSINRKARTTKADAVKVKDGNMLQTRPAEFLNGIFTPLQLNPVEFTQMSRQEKNRVILSLIEFEWDLNWIREKFGEIPQGVDYNKHILEVLAEIQAENGVYYQSRQNINRDIRNNLALVEEIARDIPEGYDAEKWESYRLGDKYRELEKIKDNNAIIARAKAFKESYDNKLRGIQAEREMAIGAEEKAIATERDGLNSTIARLKAEIKAAEDKLAGLDDKLADKIKVIEAEYQTKLAKLDNDTQVANEWADKEPVDVSGLVEEIAEAERMIKHLNEYRRMKSKQEEIEQLQAESDELTRKIELARELPGEILKTAKIPIEGLTVEDGIPLINGLPISNLSDGELLELCVDVSVCRPGQLEIILIDGAERLDEKSRAALYAKCKAKGLQLIATRVTDSAEMEVVEL